MPKNTKDDIRTVSEDAPEYSWPTTAKACELAGISPRQLENLVRTGRVHYVYDRSKDRHFDPESLANAAGVVLNTEEIKADLMASVLSESRRSIKDLSESNAKLLRLATGPAFRVIRALRQENTALRAEAEAIRTKYLSAIDSFEKALDNSHQRELERVKAESREKRLDTGWERLMEQVPSIIEQLTFKKGISGFLSSLTADQMMLLKDMLTTEQLSFVMRLMGQKGSSAQDDKSSS